MNEARGGNSFLIACHVYDALGRRNIVYYGNGTDIDYTFDMGNRLSVITNNFQTSPFGLLKFEYDTYDKVGNRKDCDITLGQVDTGGI
jgi:hypothetical protein